MSAFDNELADTRERVLALLAAEDPDATRAYVSGLHASDVADVLESLDEEARVRFLSLLPVELASEALAEMEEGGDRAGLLAALEPEKRTELLTELADDDAADLIAELEPAEQRRILDELPAEEVGELLGLLRYGEDTAGGLMTTDLVAIDASRTAAGAIEEVRRQGREVESFYTVFVVDAVRRLQGTLPLDRLIIAPPDQPIAELVEAPVATVRPYEDQEEVGRLIARYNLASMAVVSDDGRLLGRITFDDVIDVMEAEQTEDILRLAGVGDDEGLRDTWHEAVRARLPWLGLNVLTASLAAFVVYVFSETIDNVVILATIMPIVAGLGGNAGTQALAVTVRRIALDSPSERRAAFRLHVVRELIVGLINGAAVGLLVALIATLVGGDAVLGVVVLIAMWGNLVVAGFLGSFVPSVMDRLGLDPAVSSSMFVTPFTDLCGFLFLLGLGSALLL